MYFLFSLNLGSRKPSGVRIKEVTKKIILSEQASRGREDNFTLRRAQKAYRIYAQLCRTILKQKKTGQGFKILLYARTKKSVNNHKNTRNNKLSDEKKCPKNYAYIVCFAIIFGCG